MFTEERHHGALHVAQHLALHVAPHVALHVYNIAVSTARHLNENRNDSLHVNRGGGGGRVASATNYNTESGGGGGWVRRGWSLLHTLG